MKKNNSIIIEKYSDNWKTLFDKEKKILSNILPEYKDKIEHFGSTSIPNLDAKPIIDILLGVKEMNEADSLIPVLLKHNWATSPEYNKKLPESRFLLKWDSLIRTHHLHLVVFEGKIWKQKLLFRNKLRNSSVLREEYKLLKNFLIKSFSNDREKYTDEKTEFVKKVIGELPFGRPKL